MAAEDIENKVRVVLESSEIYKSDTQIIILQKWDIPLLLNGSL